MHCEVDTTADRQYSVLFKRLVAWEVYHVLPPSKHEYTVLDVTASIQHQASRDFTWSVWSIDLGDDSTVKASKFTSQRWTC